MNIISGYPFYVFTADEQNRAKSCCATNHIKPFYFLLLPLPKPNHPVVDELAKRPATNKINLDQILHQNHLEIGVLCCQCTRTDNALRTRKNIKRSYYIFYFFLQRIAIQFINLKFSGIYGPKFRKLKTFFTLLHGLTCTLYVG